MFQLLSTATLFLIIGVVAGLFGFGIVSEDAPLGAKLLSAFFLCAAAGAFWWARMTRTRFDTPSKRNSAARRPRFSSPSGDAA